MSEKSCPNCGISVPGTAENCTCGFTFVDYENMDPPAPGVVRSRGIQDGAMVAQLAPAPAPAVGSPRANQALMIPCPSCSARISKRAQECPKCGEAPYAQCQVCATRIVANASPCTECGDPDPFG